MLDAIVPKIHSNDDTCNATGCFRDYTTSRTRRRITPWSREPITGQIGEIWHLAAARSEQRTLTVDQPAHIDPDGPLTRSYGEWADLVDRTAARLYALGVRPWDRVAILKANHFDIAILACAAARIGAVPAQLSGSYDAAIIQALLRRLQRPFLIVDQTHLDRGELDAPTLGLLTRRTSCVDRVPERPDLVPLLELPSDRGAPVALRRAHEPMVITHTSGTTGIPKLVVHSADSARSLALVEAERWPFLGFRARDTWAMCAPFSHQRMTTGMLAIGTVTPTMLMVSDPTSPRIADILINHRPTVVEALPNVYLYWEKLAAHDGEPFRDVRLFINSFDAIHTRTIRMLLDASRRKLPVWVQSWSQSEAGPIVLRPYVRAMVRRRGRRNPQTQLMGWPIPGLCRIRAVDPETGAPVPVGQPGLIEVSQPGRCLSYLGEHDRHDLKVRGEYWNTGDMGVINRAGAVRILDREIDRIAGASCIELEDVLLDRLPETTEVVVLSVAGAAPVPVFSTRDDHPITKADWARVTSDLPPMAVPVQLRWQDFPRTGTWKIRRLALREQLISGARPIGLGRWT